MEAPKGPSRSGSKRTSHETRDECDEKGGPQITPFCAKDGKAPDQTAITHGIFLWLVLRVDGATDDRMPTGVDLVVGRGGGCGPWRRCLGHRVFCGVVVVLGAVTAQILGHDQPMVGTASGIEFVVGAGLDNLTLGQDDDLIGISDGRQLVGDHEGCPLGRYIVQSILDYFLGLWIQSTCGLVQDQYLGVGDDAPGNCDPLLLSS